MRIGSRLPAHLALAPALLIVLVAYCGHGMDGLDLVHQLADAAKFRLRRVAAIQQPGRQRALAGSVVNIAIFGCLFIAATLVLGFVLAALIDQRVRGENLLRSLFLYPFSMSFIVTGLAWRWLLDPTFGIQKVGTRPRAVGVPLRLAGAAGAGDIHARHCRGLARVGPGHGDHAGGIARR